MSGDECVSAVEAALRHGYRHIDTARVYRNEPQVAEGIKRSGIPRADIFLTSKLSPRDQGEEGAAAAVLESLNDLDTDYLDLYLVHWPGSSNMQGDDPAVAEKRRGTWRALQRMRTEGKLRAIGVSNFLPHHLEDLRKMEGFEVMPAVGE
ncbi:unnamed protein product [Phaeothamnion confervicola]